MPGGDIVEEVDAADTTDTFTGCAAVVVAATGLPLGNNGEPLKLLMHAVVLDVGVVNTCGESPNPVSDFPSETFCIEM